MVGECVFGGCPRASVEAANYSLERSAAESLASFEANLRKVVWQAGTGPETANAG